MPEDYEDIPDLQDVKSFNGPEVKAGKRIFCSVCREDAYKPELYTITLTSSKTEINRTMQTKIEKVCTRCQAIIQKKFDRIVEELKGEESEDSLLPEDDQS